MDTLYKILDIGTNSNGVHVAKMCCILALLKSL